jgi:predicted transcriptional regulator
MRRPRGPYSWRIDVDQSARRDHRVAAGLTQLQLARLAGVSERTVRNWEQGAPSPRHHCRWPAIERALSRAGIAGLTRSTETGNAGGTS